MHLGPSPDLGPAPFAIRDLSELASRVTREAFCERIAVDCLVGLPPPPTGRGAWSFQTAELTRQAMDEHARWDLGDSVAFPIVSKSDRDTVLIGRSSASDIVIDDASVSKLHARLLLPVPHLSDAGSANGTRVDSVPLEGDEAVPLRAGARVTFGSLDFLFMQPKLLYVLVQRVR